MGSARTATTCVMDVGEDAFESEVLKVCWLARCFACKSVSSGGVVYP